AVHEIEHSGSEGPLRFGDGAARVAGFEYHADTHSEAELRLILEASHAGGAIPESEWTLASRVFDFVHRQAKDVMVPRPDIVFLRADRPLAENRAVAESSGFTRFPLVEDGSADRIVGMVHIRDLFAGEPDDLRTVARIIPRVPETKRIDQMLRDLQRGRLHMAVVADEYGGTAGIVTLEDIIEEIVGDIQDEYDPTAPEMENSGAGYLVDARITLDKLARDLEINPPEGDVDVDTVGGWVMTQCDPPIRAGAQARYGRALFTVAETAGRRIRKVRVTVPDDFSNTAESHR
ncbi:MAG: hemolysin family protein, partial [Armatimonadota bacterium]